ncbi:hypothetical protein GJ688_13015 [Heliobacillus mobilis]|uniref:SLH domain-containing protein n=1 Tax=Heliobacterium mobile TaxID=28064 RepID=A0A6I3SLS3_HELMO|nr:carboxypeptidase regulatory-like domain-containing protein [Heliobacterium mobile]MTV49894.1 hypothetical protein [Heliobacterium mobile]
MVWKAKIHRLGLRRWFIWLLMLFILTPLCALPSPVQAAESPATFTDLQKNSPQFPFINYLVERDVISGYPDKTFRPDEGLNRASASVLLAKAAHLTVPSSIAQRPYEDVPPDFWAARTIAAVSREGFLKGFDDGSFHPNDPLTRAQGITVLLALEPKAQISLRSENNQEHPFLDIPPEHWAAKQINLAQKMGLIAGWSDGQHFRPDAPITRGEFSQALAKLMIASPSLRKAELDMQLKGLNNGTVQIRHAGQTGYTATENTQKVAAGDTIKVENTPAELLFPDGSGLLLEKGTEITLEEASGKTYITKDGKPNVKVERLKLQMPDGSMFGALASDKREAPSAKQISSVQKVFALPGEETSEPAKDREEWWKSSTETTARVEIDVPWGVASIQGTYWKIVARRGLPGEASVLAGNVRVQASGKTVQIGSGQASSIALGGAPSTPAPMSIGQQADWLNQRTWVEERSRAIEASSALASPSTEKAIDSQPAETPGMPENPGEAALINGLINHLSVSVSQAASSRSNSGGGSSSNNNDDPKGNLSFAGFVTDEQGEPVKGAKVSLFYGDRGHLIKSTVTNKKGAFTFSHLTDGDYRINTQADGYVSASSTFTLTDESVENYSIELSAAEQTVQLTGQIINKETKDPLADVRISVYEQESGTLQKQTTSDSKGSFELSVNIDPALIYRFVAESNGYEQYEQTLTVSPQDQEIDLGTISLKPSSVQSSLSGIVVDATNNHPISGATVTLLTTDTEQVVGTAVLSEDGKFTFEHLDSPAYTLRVSAAGYIDWNESIMLNVGHPNQRTIALSPVIENQALRIVLSWGEKPSDLDAHLVGYEGNTEKFHLYFGQSTNEEFGAHLDVDNTNGYGPETITLDKYTPGITYEFYVHDYSDAGNEASTELSASSASVKVYRAGEKAPQTFQVPAGQGDRWRVLRIDGSTGQLTAINQIDTIEAATIQALRLNRKKQ